MSYLTKTYVFPSSTIVFARFSSSFLHRFSRVKIKNKGLTNRQAFCHFCCFVDKAKSDVQAIHVKLDTELQSPIIV